MCTKVFSIVSDAHDFLTKPEKRKELEGKIKQDSANKQMNSEDLINRAIPLLERSKFKEAYKLMKEAIEIYESPSAKLYFLWAKIKADPQSLKVEYDKIFKELQAFEAEDRRNHIYYFVMGLMHAIAQEYDQAEALYQRSLEINKNFLVARRELAVISAIKKQEASAGQKANDLLTGDLTAIISGLFSKKKSG